MRHPGRLRRFVLAVALSAVSIVSTAPPASAGMTAVTVYEPGGIDERTLEAVAQAARATGANWTELHRGTIRLLQITRGSEVVQEAAPGFGYPMSVLALDPLQSLPIIGRRVADSLARGEVVFGARSAALRGARAGDHVEFIGWDGRRHRYPIGLVTPDEDIRWAEMAFSTTEAQSFGFERSEDVAVWNLPARDVFQIEMGRQLPRARLRISAAGDTPNPDWVLPPVLIKEQFGEFAYRPTRGDGIAIEAAWRVDNIVTTDHPLVGPFRCHRRLIPQLLGALDEIEARGLGHLIDRGDFQRFGGCYNPRLIRGGDKGGSVSRHAWGAAIDLNALDNPYGGRTNMDPGIVSAFRRWGFAWGGGWTFPDGGHFEWKHPETPRPLPRFQAPLPG